MTEVKSKAIQEQSPGGVTKEERPLKLCTNVGTTRWVMVSMLWFVIQDLHWRASYFRMWVHSILSKDTTVQCAGWGVETTQYVKWWVSTPQYPGWRVKTPQYAGWQVQTTICRMKGRDTPVCRMRGRRCYRFPDFIGQLHLDVPMHSWHLTSVNLHWKILTHTTLSTRHKSNFSGGEGEGAVQEKM